MHLLLVEDERKLAALLKRGLGAEGYVVDVIHDGEEALSALAEGEYDLAILDVMLPGRDGISVCRRLRARGDHTPVLMLTARDAVPDRVRGLDAGADDYLTKPFAFQELLARLRALARRRGPQSDGDVLQGGDLALDLRTRQARRGMHLVDLTTREFALLETFMRHPNQVLTRAQLLGRVWGLDYLSASNVVDVYVRYLRTKLGDDGETRLETVRGAGYRLRVPLD